MVNFTSQQDITCNSIKSSPPLVALVQDLIHCRMYIQATITGLRVGFTTRRCMATTGHLV